MQRGGSVYILTNVNKTTLYTGVTSDLVSRILEHKQKKYSNSFSAKYNLNILVYYENFPSIEEAIKREKYIKGKVRKWKNELISVKNPRWEDLWFEIENW